ncbi:MAG TPA: glycosyltransferase family 2 protein [Acidimicrobiales bacterium]|nr:glycosyltransferase family 2 protein [Acidimicrobiales bacterium]
MGSPGAVVLDAVNAAAFFLVASYVAYVVLIVVPMVRRHPAVPGDAGNLAWHFIVPCLNEQAVVADTVRRLVSQFPEAGIWCVDDGSDDATASVLAGLQAEYPQVHVVTRRAPDARTGKGPALNAGWRAVVAALPAGADPERTVVAVIDADGHLDPACLDMVAGPSFLGDPAVGAVQIKVRVSDRSAPAGFRLPRRQRLLIRLQDVEFTGVIAAQQMLRRHLGSVGMGGNGQFTRLSVLQEIARTYGTPWHGSLLEDFELGLHVLLVGHRTQYCHETWVEQEGLASFWGLVRQRSRWAQGNMQCWRYLGAVLRSRNIATPGALEIAYFLLLPWVQVVGSVLYVVVLSLFSYYALATPGGPLAWFDGGAWGIIPLLILFGIGPLAIWGPVYRRCTDRRLSRVRALALGLANWPYTTVHYLATWWAFSRVVRARHDWKKTARVAPGPSPVPPLPAPVRPQPVPRPAAATVAAPITAVPTHLVAGTFARSHRRRFEYRRTTAVGRFRPRAMANPLPTIERNSHDVSIP